MTNISGASFAHSNHAFSAQVDANGSSARFGGVPVATNVLHNGATGTTSHTNRDGSSYNASRDSQGQVNVTTHGTQGQTGHYQILAQAPVLSPAQVVPSGNNA